MKAGKAALAVFAFCTITLSAVAYAAPDASAPVVYLRTDCTEGGVGLVNCFTTMDSLVTWINNTRHPSATNPLDVEIGPGTFSAFSCQDGGYTTLKGSGRQNTIITNGQVYGGAFYASNCTQLDLSELTILGTANALHTMDWLGTGTSTWSNVDIAGNSYGWWDTGGTHFWFGCRFINKAGYGVSRAYQTQGVSWFFGSEIEADAANGASEAMALGVNGGEAHVYGGAIRTLVPGGNGGSTIGSSTGIKAVRASGASAEVHIHGTGIDVISGPGNQIAALIADSGAMIHANGAAYNLSTGTGGTVYRILNNGGHIHAPYLWEHIPDPTTIPNYTSVTGADITTVTTGTSDGHPHTVIYDASCTSKWYDTVDKACRP